MIRIPDVLVCRKEDVKDRYPCFISENEARYGEYFGADAQTGRPVFYFRNAAAGKAVRKVPENCGDGEAYRRECFQCRQDVLRDYTSGEKRTALIRRELGKFLKRKRFVRDCQDLIISAEPEDTQAYVRAGGDLFKVMLREPFGSLSHIKDGVECVLKEIRADLPQELAVPELSPEEEKLYELLTGKKLASLSCAGERSLWAAPVLGKGDNNSKVESLNLVSTSKDHDWGVNRNHLLSGRGEKRSYFRLPNGAVIYFEDGKCLADLESSAASVPWYREDFRKMFFSLLEEEKWKMIKRIDPPVFDSSQTKFRFCGEDSSREFVFSRMPQKKYRQVFMAVRSFG